MEKYQKDIRLPFNDNLQQEKPISDLPAFTAWLGKKLHTDPLMIKRGVLALLELDESYEGGIPQKERNAFFSYYLYKRGIDQTKIVRVFFSKRYENEGHLYIRNVISEVESDSVIDVDLQQLRNALFYIADRDDTFFEEDKKADLEKIATLLIEGNSPRRIGREWLAESTKPTEFDVYMVRSRLIVDVLTAKSTIAEKLAALAQYGLSDKEMLQKIGSISENVNDTSQNPELYGLYIAYSYQLLAESKSTAEIMQKTGLTSADLADIVEYFTHEDISVSQNLTHTIADMLKSGIAIQNMYTQLREAGFPTKAILAHPLYACNIVKNIQQRIRDGETQFSIIEEGLAPKYIVSRIAKMERLYRKQLFDTIIENGLVEGSDIITLYTLLLQKRFRIHDILTDERIFVPLQQLVLALQANGVTWKNIMAQTGLTERTLQEISKESIKSGKTKSRKIGIGGSTKEERDEMDQRVLECIQSGITNYDEIAKKLQIKRWQAHMATHRLIKANLTPSRQAHMSEKNEALRKKILECTEDHLDRLNAVQPEVTESFVRSNSDLFISLEAVANEAHVQYRGHISEIVVLVQKSKFPLYQIESIVHRNGKEMVMRRYYVPFQAKRRMVQHFINNSQ